jgi:hypothetical protein
VSRPLARSSSAAYGTCRPSRSASVAGPADDGGGAGPDLTMRIPNRAVATESPQRRFEEGGPALPVGIDKAGENLAAISKCDPFMGGS